MCEHKCAFTRNRSELSSADLVLFNYQHFKSTDVPPLSPFNQQIWGLFHPSPQDRKNSSDLNEDHFDMLISYLPQSDVQLYRHILQFVNKSSTEETGKSNFQSLVSDLISSASEGGRSVQQHIRQQFQTDSLPKERGRKRKREADVSKQLEETRKHRTVDRGPGDIDPQRTRRAYHYESKLVATIINKCVTNSNREAYMKDLSAHVRVHVYGDCGVPCPGHRTEDCLQYLAKFYKFLLVFESDICEHYMSDLVWKSLQTNMIPVIFGGGDYSRDLPVSSYIDAMPQTPENLAHFLIYLDKNPLVYSSYLQWKENYRVEEERWECEICKLLYATEPSKLKLINTRRRSRILQSINSSRCTRWPTLQFSVHQ